jgi:hypothetical protein
MSLIYADMDIVTAMLDKVLGIVGVVLLIYFLMDRADARKQVAAPDTNSLLKVKKKKKAYLLVIMAVLLLLSALFIRKILSLEHA